MRYLGLTIAFLGLFQLLSAAPDREKRQVETTLQEQCRAVFNVACDSIGEQSNGVTPPPLNRATTSATGSSDCECVQYYQCNLNGTFNTDGATIIDRRISPCPGILEVCCKDDFRVPGTNGGTTEPTNLNTGSGVTVPTPGPTPTAGPTPTPVPTPRPTIAPIPVKPGCGHRNPGGISIRITGNNENEAQFGEFPWMVAILQKAVAPANQNQYACGGSLIHPRVILTAAHTIENKKPSDLIVRAGEWDTQTVSEPIRHQEREVEAILVHENYNTRNLHWDFALVILKNPVEVGPTVNTICLPEETANFDAARCTATGWGKDKFEQSGKFQAVLKRIVLPVVPHTPCQTFLRLTRLGKAFILDPSFICAGGEPGLDTCTGDGGSPLACPLANARDRYVQSGIVAWGINCGADRTPGVYGNVAKARRWIDSKMAQYNFDTSSYIA